MATKVEPTADEIEQWEDIKVGLGREWDLEHDGILTGTFVGMETLEVDDKQNGGTRPTNAYRFEVLDGGDPNRFVWGSYNIDQAMKEINIADVVRIEYLGTDTFNGDRGPQQVKTYRIQRRKTN